MTTPSSPTSLISGRDLLLAAGLQVEGPILWGKLTASTGPGVFIVELPAAQPKVAIDPQAIRDWLVRAPELRLDGKQPTVKELQTRLASFWLPDQAIIYIGSSLKAVSARLAGMYKTPLGERRPQPAGYWLKTLHDLSKARIWWSPTSDPELYEDQLVTAFVKATGSLPYAMLTGDGQRRQHGLVAPLHDAGVPKPVKVTKVTVLPDATQSDMEWSSAPIRSGATRPISLAKPKRPKAAPKKPAPKPVVVTGPSAIEKVVVRRSSKAAVVRPPIEETHLTAEGLDALRTELEELTTLRRPEVIARIKAARELGDLRENADYESARKEQSFLEGRVQQLQQMIKFAVIIEHGGEIGAEVTLGATVVVETDRHGQETFTIVGSAEADAAAGKISFTSPIGRALLGRRPGETIRVEIPSGTLDFKVTEVR